MVHVAECKVGVSEDELTTAISGLGDGHPICIASITIPHGSNEDLLNTLLNSAKKAELVIDGPTYTLIEAACSYYTLSPSSIPAQSSNSTILCLQIGEHDMPSYSTLMKISQAEPKRRPEMVSEIYEHPSTASINELVEMLVSPLIEKADYIMLVPSVSYDLLDKFVSILATSFSHIPILRPTRSDAAYGMALRSSFHAQNLFANPTFNRFVVIPIGIVTAQGNIVNVIPAETICPVDRTVVFQTSKEGQTAVTVQIVVGALGSFVTENENNRRVLQSIRLDDLVLPCTDSRVFINVRIVVKKSYDVAISLEQQSGPCIVVPCPGLLRRIGTIREEYSMMNEVLRSQPDGVGDGVVAELPE